MTESEESRERRDQDFDRITQEYYEAIENGGAPSEADFLARYPEFADELQSFLSDVRFVDGTAERQSTKQSGPHAKGDVETIAGGAAHVSAVGNTIRYLGDYEVLEEIGRGGMGVVYRARQVSLNRLVAIKLMLNGSIANESERQRFNIEAEAAASLEHPNIAPVFEVGHHQGWNYLSMKLLAGGSLAYQMPRYLRDPRAGVHLIQTIAKAIHFAHQRGILHRDLKPSNVLFGADGTPYITDFGLAKSIRGQADITELGEILGTPSYMSPEQASGRAKHATISVDIYALGAILYEICTGRPPFRDVSVLETLQRIMHEDPISIRKVNSGIDRDLEAICLKCLSKDATQRYGSAESLAQDLDRWLSGLPVAARRSRLRGTVETIWRSRPGDWLLFAPPLMMLVPLRDGLQVGYAKVVPPITFFNGLEPSISQTLFGYLAATAFVGSAMSIIGFRRRPKSWALQIYGVTLLLAIIIATIYRVTANPIVTHEVVSRFTGYLALSKQDETYMGIRDGIITSIAKGDPSPRTVFAGDGAGCKNLRISGNGEYLVAICEDLELKTDAAYVHELPSGRLLQTIGFDGFDVGDAAFGSDHNEIAVLVNSEFDRKQDKWVEPPDGNLLIYNLRDGSLKSKEDTPPLSASWQAIEWKGDCIAVASAYGNQRGTLLWNTKTHSVIHLLAHPANPSGPLSVALSPDVTKVAVGYAPNSVAVWDTATGMELFSAPSQNWVVCLDFSPDGNYLAYGEGNSSVRICDANSGDVLQHFGMGSQNASNYTRSLRFNSLGERLACGTENGHLVVWRVTK